MRAVVQRATRGSVVVGEETIGVLDPQPGLVILVGVGPNDSEAQALLLADKIAGLRIFADDDGKTNRSLLDIGGGALVVSQFTLFADLRRGRRPGFTTAAAPDGAIGDRNGRGALRVVSLPRLHERSHKRAARTDQDLAAAGA